MVRKSPYWKHFIEIDKLQAHCKLCDKVVTYSGNTSNLKSHMSVSHSSVLVEIESKKRKLNNSQEANSPCQIAQTIFHEEIPSKSSQEDSSSSAFQSKSSSNNIYQSKDSKGEAENIKKSFADISAFKQGGTKCNNMTDKILYMICKDCEPFNIVERDGFKTMLHYAVPNYKVPSRTTMSNRLDDKYKKISAKYREVLKEVEEVTLTTDIWTDTLNTRSYIGVTVHFVKDGNLTSGSLGVRELTTSHTGEHIRDALRDICREWDLKTSKITAIVTDNGPNVVRGVDLFVGKNFHLACCAHTINLVAEKTIASVPELPALITRVKEIVTFFKQSVRASDDLRKKTDLKLKQEVPTRWNSTFYMLVRFIELRSYVNEIVNNYSTAPAMLTAREMEMLTEIVDVLRPLEIATRELSAQKYVTASTVIPLIHGIEEEITNLKPKSEMGKNLVQTMLNQLHYRFGEIESVHTFAIATILDPRFKTIEFINFDRASRALKFVKDMLTAKINSQSDNANPLTSAQETKESQKDVPISLWNRHKKLKEKAQANKNEILSHDVVSALPDELNLYLKAPLINLSEDPMRYWADMTIMLSNLAPIAIKYLSVVATSVPCERLFSKAGHIMSEKRNRLKGPKLHKQLFLNQIDKSLWQTKARKKFQRNVWKVKRSKFCGVEGDTAIALQQSSCVYRTHEILHAWGDTLEEAFEQCAMAMFGYMTELEKVEIKEVHLVEAEGHDMQSLLFHFLDELLFLFCAEPFLIARTVHITEFDREGFKIKARAAGEEFRIGKHSQGAEIKAITYSAMQIIDQPEAERPEVFVIVDI